MTWEQLYDAIGDMTEDQLKTNVIVVHDGDWMFPDLITTVAVNYCQEEDTVKPGQPILM